MLTVLLVDPSAFTRKKLARELEARGYRVLACAQGETAILACEDLRPDVAVLARWLPDVDGLSAVRRLRQIDLHLPIVFTGSTSKPAAPRIDTRWHGRPRAVNPFVAPMQPPLEPQPEPQDTLADHEPIFRAIARILRPVVA